MAKDVDRAPALFTRSIAIGIPVDTSISRDQVPDLHSQRGYAILTAAAQSYIASGVNYKL